MVEHREGGHRDDHAHEAQKPAEQQDGEQYPEAGESCGVAQNLGAQDVSIKLLQHQHEQHKVQTLHGVHHQDQKRAGDRADEGPEERDHVGHADDHADQEHVGHPQKPHAEKADDADNQGVQQLPGDKSAEHAVGETDLLDDAVGLVQVEQAVHDLLCLGGQRVLDV